MAATIGVPLYACGGGTIPLLITNLGAVKIVLGIRHFILYLAFIMIFALMTGFTVNLIL